MDILEKIIDNIKSKSWDKWKEFNANESIKEAIKQGHRIPNVPTIFQDSFPKDEMFLIAEIKQASPSQGIICENFNPIEIAQTYIDNNVDAISILTEEDFFRGHLNDLRQVRSLTSTLPLLRKDFIVHPFQVKEAYDYGADMVLLIVAALEDDELAFLYNYILDFGMTPLVEVHNERELERAMRLNPTLIGINNRDLRTFKVDINTSVQLKKQIPLSSKVISESGIFTEAHVRLLKEQGLSGMLVGQSILESNDTGEFIRCLKLKER